MRINPIMTAMLEAKCPRCSKKAEVSDEMTVVRCRHCTFVASYDDYIEIMKGKAVDIGDNFQMSWDRNPF
jgi:phage FluMu protein Com